MDRTPHVFVVRRPLELKELPLVFILRNAFKKNEKNRLAGSKTFNTFILSMPVD